MFRTDSIRKGGEKMAEHVFHHFSLVRIDSLRMLSQPGLRDEIQRTIFTRLRAGVDAFYMYQVFPFVAEADLLFWCVMKYEDESTPARFAEHMAGVWMELRHTLTVRDTYWGYTRPSQYSRGKSEQELDAFSQERKRYLIMYPFIKVSEWYLLSREERQKMMSEHIRVGRQFPHISQLLLYSFGLQDQEFIVVYEADDLKEFSELVQRLRSTEVRKYTLRDTPILTCVYGPPEGILQRFMP